MFKYYSVQFIVQIYVMQSVINITLLKFMQYLKIQLFTAIKQYVIIYCLPSINQSIILKNSLPTEFTLGIIKLSCPIHHIIFKLSLISPSIFPFKSTKSLLLAINEGPIVLPSWFYLLSVNFLPVFELTYENGILLFQLAITMIQSIFEGSIILDKFILQHSLSIHNKQLFNLPQILLITISPQYFVVSICSFTIQKAASNDKQEYFKGEHTPAMHRLVEPLSFVENIRENLHPSILKNSLCVLQLDSLKNICFHSKIQLNTFINNFISSWCFLLNDATSTHAFVFVL